MTWVSVVPASLPVAEMLLPAHLWTGPDEILLRYGSFQKSVRVRPTQAREPPDAAGGSLERPLSVQISAGVVESLHMRTEPVYQMLRRGENVLEIGPVLGLLLGHRNHWYTDWYLSREPQRVTRVYPRTGGLICAFSPRNVSTADHCAYGLWYNPQQDHWCYDALPLPNVIWRRSFKCDPALVRELQTITGARLFNSRRYDKWELHGILSRDEAFLKYLPETARADSVGTVLTMLHRHRAVVLKPSDLSRGRGILFLKTEGESYLLTDYREAPKRVELLDREAVTDLVEQQILGRRYLCQQRIDLAQVAGGAFDVRIVMQKNTHGRWQCGGIECRVAGQGQILTNIAAGGRALTLRDATLLAFDGRESPEAKESEVIGIAEWVCRLLDETGETFGEFGVDVALDTAGNPWLIEANVIPTFKGFRSIGMEIYHRLLAAPLLFANHLAGFGEDGDGGDVPD